MSKKIYKIALVGCGRVAQHYIKIIKQQYIQIEAVCDIKKSKAIEMSKKLIQNLISI